MSCKPRRQSWWSGLVLAAAGTAGCAATPDGPTEIPAASAGAANAASTVEPKPEVQTPPELPGIAFDLDAGFVDLDATVIGRGCEWLELVACTPGTREHEALVTIEALPSHLHLALLLLGVEPGQPQTGVRGEDGWEIVPPRGGAVDLHFVVPGDKGEAEQVVPVEAWVLDRASASALPDTPGGWMFTGSRMMRDHREPEGEAVYLADMNGTAVSLVHFGDETLGRETGVSEANDGQNLAPLEAAMPPNGTEVRLRVSRVEPANAPAEP